MLEQKISAAEALLLSQGTGWGKENALGETQ